MQICCNDMRALIAHNTYAAIAISRAIAKYLDSEAPYLARYELPLLVPDFANLHGLWLVGLALAGPGGSFNDHTDNLLARLLLTDCLVQVIDLLRLIFIDALVHLSLQSDRLQEIALLIQSCKEFLDGLVLLNGAFVQLADLALQCANKISLTVQLALLVDIASV